MGSTSLFITIIHLTFPPTSGVCWVSRNNIYQSSINFLLWNWLYAMRDQRLPSSVTLEFPLLGRLEGLRKLSWACISLNPHIPFRVAAAWTSSSCLHTRNGWCKQFNREPAWHSESGCQLSFVPVVNPFALHKRWKIGLCYLH